MATKFGQYIQGKKKLTGLDGSEEFLIQDSDGLNYVVSVSEVGHAVGLNALNTELLFDNNDLIQGTTGVTYNEATGELSISEGLNLSYLVEYSVPYVEADGLLASSEATVDSTTKEWTFAHTITVPGGTIKVGDTTSISSSTGQLIIENEVDNELYYNVSSIFSTAGSTKPVYLDLGAEYTLNIETGETTTFTDNPLTFSLTGSVVSPNVRQINAVTVKTDGVLTNFRGKFTDNATGKVLRHFPSKFEWDSGTGITTADGENFFDFINKGTDSPGTYYLGVNPLIIEENQVVDLEFRADSMSLYGVNAPAELPYLIAQVQDGPFREIAHSEVAERNQKTGLISGGIITQESSTTISWTAGTGVIADYIDPLNPVITELSWDAVAPTGLATIGTDGTTLLGYNAAGVVTEILISELEINDSHTYVFFGSVTHYSGQITEVSTVPGNIGYDGIGSFADFALQVIGPANINGNIYGSNGANLNVDLVGGQAFIPGANARIDPSLPDTVTLASGSAVDMIKMYRSADPGLTMLIQGVASDAVDPDNYDDGTGTLASVTSGYWTIQRIFRSRNGDTYVAYGQQEFSTKELAVAALGNEPFTEKSPLPFMLFRSSLLIKQGATDLSDTAEAEFFTQSSFRMDGATSSTTTIPGITTPGSPDTSVQFNNGGLFGGDATFTFNDTTKVLSATTFTGDLLGTINTATTGVTQTLGDSSTKIATTEFVADTIAAEALWTRVGTVLSPTTAGDDVTTTGNIGAGILAPISTLHVYDNNTTTGASAGITIEQDGTGDSVLHFLLTGGQRWSMGIDNSVDNVFRISDTANLSNVIFQIDETVGVGVGVNRSETKNWSTSSGIELVNLAVTDNTFTSIVNRGDGDVASGILFKNDDFSADYGSIVLGVNGTDGLLDAMTISNTGTADLINSLNTPFGGLGRLQNLFTYSEDLSNADWELDGATPPTVTANFAEAPNGETTATRVNFTAAVGVTGIIKQVISVTQSNVYTLSFWAKMNANDNETFTFNLGSGGTKSLVIDSDAWKRYSVEVTAGAGGYMNIFHTGAADVYFWGMQVNDGSEAFPYTKTTATSMDTEIYGGVVNGNLLTKDSVGIGIDPISTLHVYEDTTHTSASGGVTIEQDGTGDSLLHFLLTGGQRWTMGIDNSVSDVFRISTAADLSSDIVFQIEQTSGIGVGVNRPETTNWSTSSGIELINLAVTDDTFTSIVNRGDGAVASGILFKNDDFSLDYGSIVFGVRGASGLLDAMTISNTGVVSVPDDGVFAVGDGDDLQIYHDGTNTIVNNLTGNLTIENSDDFGEIFIKANGTTGGDIFLGLGTDTDSNRCIVQNHSGAEKFFVDASGVVNIPTGSRITFGNATYKGDLQYNSTTANIEFDTLAGSDFDIMSSAVYVREADKSVDLINSLNTPFGGLGRIQNLLTYSEDLTKTSGTAVKTVNYAEAPNGETAASRVVFSSGGGILRKGVALTQGNTYTLSFWSKFISGAVASLAIDFGDSTAVQLDVSDTEWRRYTATTVAGASNWVDMARFNDLELYIWGIQLNEGSEAFPYVKTTDTAIDTNIKGAAINGDLVTENVDLDAVDFYNGSLQNTAVLPTDCFGEIESGIYKSAFSLTTQDTAPTSVWFRCDGTKFYVSGNANDSIFEYDLSTPWDISTASYSTNSFDLSSELTTPMGVALKLDGTKMYVLGLTNQAIYQYTLSTAWDVSTASYDSVSLNVSTEDTSPRAIVFSIDGKNMFMLGSTNSTVYKYTLTTPWDLSTASYASQSFSVASEDASSIGMTFRADGTGFYICGSTADASIYSYKMSTPFDLSTAYYTGYFLDVSDEDNTPESCYISPYTSNLFVLGNENDNIYEYEIGISIISTVFKPVASSPHHEEGKVYYNSTDKSLTYQTSSPGVEANISKEVFVPPLVKNDQGSAITNGQVVYMSGTDGTYPEVKLAKADVESTSLAIGVITEASIANGSTGYCTSYGLVRGLNLSAFSNADVLYVSTSVAGGLQNTVPTWPDVAVKVGQVINNDSTDGVLLVEHPTPVDALGSRPVTKSYTMGDYGSANTNYVGGYYDYAATSVTLTVGGTATQTFVDTNRASAAHAFCVAAGAASGASSLTVSGTSIDDDGVRTTSDSEIIVSDPNVASTNEYFETSKKWLGQITYTLTGTGSFTFNYGIAKYEDFGNNDFTIQGFEAVGKSTANAGGTDIILRHHQSTGWVYSAGAFEPTPTVICSMKTDYASTDDQIDADEYFAYKRANLNTFVEGSAMEGIIIEFYQTTNNALWYGNFHVGVRL